MCLYIYIALYIYIHVYYSYIHTHVYVYSNQLDLNRLVHTCNTLLTSLERFSDKVLMLLTPNSTRLHATKTPGIEAYMACIHLKTCIHLGAFWSMKTVSLPRQNRLCSFCSGLFLPPPKKQTPTFHKPSKHIQTIHGTKSFLPAAGCLPSHRWGSDTQVTRSDTLAAPRPNGRPNQTGSRNRLAPPAVEWGRLQHARAHENACLGRPGIGPMIQEVFLIKKGRL